jgi:5'-nucleotidase
MRWKTFLITALFFVICLAHSSSHGKDIPLTLIYSSNTLGEVEPCGTCPETGDNGGLARRAHYIKKVREEVKNLLVLDGGDALVMSYFGRPTEREKAQKKAEFLLKVYEKIGYDAINIGDTDIGLGIKYLQALQKRSKIPFISANLVYSGTDKPVFKPYLIKEINGSKVGIIGLLPSELPVHMHKELKGYFIKDPFQTATAMMRYLTARCDYLIALAHLSLSDIESLIEISPRFSIIIGGQDRSFALPKEVYGSLVVQTDAFGIHIGRLNLKLTKRFSDHFDIFPRTLLQKNIGEYQNFLTLMHPGTESDPEIEKLITASKDQLKKPIPW